MRVCSIASGSSGNCVYVGSQAVHLLVDIGISKKKTEVGLNSLGITGNEIDGIFITHEHTDHINGIGVFLRKYHTPVYATEKTIQEILRCKTLGSLDVSLFHKIKADQKIMIKDVTIHPMSISHDAADPVAYRISYGKKKVGICTDLGSYNRYTIECLKEMNVLLIEANHDVRMLEAGSYPYYLKQRILGKKGHLSNEDSGKLLSSILHDKLQAIILGHLSIENNLPELAYETVRMEIEAGDNPYHANDFLIQVAKRSEVSQVVSVT